MKDFQSTDQFGDRLEMAILDRDTWENLGGEITVIQPRTACSRCFEPVTVLKKAQAKRLVKWLQKAIEEIENGY